MQRVFFDGEMRDVGVVAQVLRDNGRSEDYIFRRVGFLLGLMSFETTQADVAVASNRYPCTFECVVARMEVTR